MGYSKTDLSYIAAFLDTDGCITMGFGRKTKAGYSIMAPQILFYNRDIVTLEWIKGFTGGKIYDKPRKDKQSIARQLAVREQMDILRSLRAVILYMRIKKYRAQLLLEFLESRIARGWKKHMKLSPTEREQEIAQEIREVNQKGFYKNNSDEFKKYEN